MSSCACSTPTPTRSGSSCRSARPSTGTATCRSSVRASATATASTVPTRPAEGHRFNPYKLLLDPYAKSIEGPIRFDAGNVLPVLPSGEHDADLEPDDEDDAEAIPKCVVIDPRFDWEGDRPLRTPWNQTVIYETHVKGFTKLRPGVREDLRGTYAGLASEDAIAHLQVARRHRGRAAAGAPHRRRALPAREGADQLLGLLVDRLLRAALGLRRDRRPRPGGARVQGHGQGAAPRRASR